MQCVNCSLAQFSSDWTGGACIYSLPGSLPFQSELSIGLVGVLVLLEMETEAIASTPSASEAVANPPAAQQSVLEKFLAKRELVNRIAAKPKPPSPSRTASRRSVTAVAAAPSPPSAVPTLPLWHSYSKRRHGERVGKLRAAMRAPEPDYAECLDAYVRHKKTQRFLSLHADAADVSGEFDTATRAMFFQRAVVDRPVCDREQNRRQYDEHMRALALQELG